MKVFEIIVRIIEKYLIKMPSLSEILTSKIGKHGKSKAYIASQLGVSEKTIENYMNGKRDPKPKAIIKLAELLNFNLNDLSEQNVQAENEAKNGLKTDFSDIDMTTMTMKPTFGEKKPAVTIEDLQKKIIALEAEKKTLQEMIDKLLQKR